MPTTADTITYFVAADGTLRDGPQGSIAQQPRINYGTEYAVTLSFPPSTIAEGDQLQVALNRTRTFFSSASATGDAPVAAVVKHDVTTEEAAAQEVEVVLSTNTRAMIDQVNGIDHPVRGFFGVHVLRGQSFVTLAVADALMMSLESGPDAISPSLPVVDYPTREEAEALADRSENAAERAEQAAAGIVPPLQLSAPPTTSTSGSVGQLAVYHDSATSKDHLYHLCFVSEGESATLYHWEECVLYEYDGQINASIIPLAYTYGIKTMVYGGKTSLALDMATSSNINGRENTRAIVPYNLDYAVRSVLPNVTEIPAATSDYSLVDSSATTNNHSHVYSHAPTTAPTYRLPQVTNTAIAHYIELTVDFTAVQTYSFLDRTGEPIVPLFTPSIAAGDVYTFKMEYSAIKAAWLIYPQKQGAVADDFVMRGEVGAANGVAPLNASGLIDKDKIPMSSMVNSVLGLKVTSGSFAIEAADTSAIDTRNNGHVYPLRASLINYAVTAALTDANHITLNDAQKATAQSVFGVGAGPILGTTAPSTSTVGVVGQLYVDTTTSKTYHCTAVANTGTESEPVWSYTWTDDINAKGGTVQGELLVGSRGYSFLGNYIRLGSVAQTLTCQRSIIVGNSNYNINYDSGAIGEGIISHARYSLNVGRWNKDHSDAFFVIGNGAGNNNRRDAMTVLTNGDLYIAGGYQQADTIIPAATTAYTLAEGMQSHVPEAASVYTLPAVTDATRTHECILTIKFSSAVLTYEFQDSEGTTLVPLPLNGDIEAGSVVTFLCRYNPLLSQWVIYPIMDGKEAI